MKTIGGKFYTRKWVGGWINHLRNEGQLFVEPFCGSCWITAEVESPRIASDANKAVITLWGALQDGWKPPTECSEERYRELRNAYKLDDPETCFVGFNCSFGGVFFQGYARSQDRRGNTVNYCLRGLSTLNARLLKLQDVQFLHRNYEECQYNDAFIYCDPPYEGTIGFKNVPKFSHDDFYNTVRGWIQNNNIVLLSEYQAPDDFVCIDEYVTRRSTGNPIERVGNVRIEKLFMHESQAHSAKREKQHILELNY